MLGTSYARLMHEQLMNRHDAYWNRSGPQRAEISSTRRSNAADNANRTVKVDARIIKPRRYVLATSVGLTPANKAELRAAIGTYCRSDDDILGRDDLNNLLGRHPTIEQSHFKLWLTSTSVLKKVLNNGTFVLSEEEEEHIRRRFARFVPNDSVHRAREILDRHHVCIIAGIPGIGKTTLAEVLVVGYLDQGYELVKVSADIAEAIQQYSSEHKQVFYYDDFLGQTSLEFKLNKNEEKRLLDFIRMVARQGSNKRIILTTREYILRRAGQIFEVLGRADLDPKTCVIDLADYTNLHRAQILYNHLYFSDLPRVYLRNLSVSGMYHEIVQHPHYNPRLIEQMTAPERVRSPDGGATGR